jgi:pilus assembly protein CpaF
VHRLDGGLERGESDARSLSPDGFPIYTPPDLDRARWIPVRDIKYVVFGSLDDPDLEADPGEKSQARKAILRFRDGELIAAYMDSGQPPDGAGLAIKIRLTERQRVIPAIAANPALLEMQFVDLWSTSTDSAQPHRRRSDIVEAAARQGRDLQKLANDFRDRLALIRDVGLTTGDTLAFSRAVRMHLDRFLAEDGINLNSVEKTALADIILRAAVGYGPLDGLLNDRSVSEIMVNGPDQVFIERRGVLTKADVRFEDENQLLETIRRMVATTGRHIDGLNPMVDARLPDGSRVNAIIRPAAIHGAALTIRKFKDAVLGMDDLTREGSLSPAMAEFLTKAVLGRMNILVSGGTGSGKTTTLNVIARFIPHNQRVITIEDAAELQIDHPHVVALEHRPANVEGKGELSIRQLLRNSLRMRPDRILVGEVRGAEALDMLQAMNTGHDGSMSTIHSNSARDALSRLETMVMMASIDIPFEAVRAQIASAVNLIVHQARMPDGRRKVAQIAEVVGYDANGAILRDIFLLGMGTDLRLEYNATGYIPTSLDKAAFYGVQVNQDLFDPVKARFVPAGSDSMMPVVKDPLMSGQRGGGENVVRQVVVVPFSSDRPGASQQQHTVQSTPTQPASTMASTPEVQEEMRKLIDAARSAVADLHAAAPQPSPRPEAPAETPAQASAAPAAASEETLAPATQAPPVPAVMTSEPAPLFASPPAEEGAASFGAGAPEPSAQANQALQAATAMARASTAFGQMAAAAGLAGSAGMLPTIYTEGNDRASATRRINAVIESLIARKGLNQRLAPAVTEAFEGAELKASDYAGPNHISKESAGRELRQAVEAGVLELVRYPQGEAGFRADPDLLRDVAEGLGQQVNAAQPLTPETIIGSLSRGQTEGTVTIMFTDLVGSTDNMTTRGQDVADQIRKAHDSIVDEKVAEHIGRKIKGTGDGSMASFGSSRHGVECALDIQRAIAEYSRQNPERKFVNRIGLNTGEVVEEAGDMFGAAVNVAARVARKAKGGEILISDVVRQLVGPVAEMEFKKRGSFKLKGFPDRWTLYQATAVESTSLARSLPTGDGFVGRDQERLDIRTVLDTAVTGSGDLLLISGPPGIGASRLAAEVAADASRNGWMVLSGRCAEQASTPYAVFREILSAAVASSGTKTLRDAAGENGPLLARLVPALRQKVRGMPAAPDISPDKLRQRMFQAVFEFLVTCQGGKPLLMVFDDLQWADAASLKLLQNLAERLPTSPMVLVATYWETELESDRPFRPIVSRLLKRRRARSFALGRLSDEEVRKMVLAMAETTPLQPGHVEGIQGLSEGNPLFVEHTYLQLAAAEKMESDTTGARETYTDEDLELARTLGGLIGRRFKRFSEPARTMLVDAAFLDGEFDQALLQRFRQVSEREMRDALDEATHGHFLTTNADGSYRFAHDLVRQRVLARLEIPVLRQFHLAWADVLEGAYGESAYEHAGEIGHHYYQASGANSTKYLPKAARNALAVGAFEEVQRLVDQYMPMLPADMLGDRAEALAMYGQASWGLGRIDEAKAKLNAARQRYADQGDAKAVAAVQDLLETVDRKEPPAQAEPLELDPGGVEPVERPEPV